MGYALIKMVLLPFMWAAYRTKIFGREHLPQSGPVIVVANHVSFIDSFFLPLATKRRVTFLAKAEYFDNKKVAWFFRLAGQIPIKREGGSATERALASAREVLDAGGCLGIYPEGTRSPDGRLYKGRTGVARMALACHVPVVPMGLIGTAEIQPIGSKFPRIFRKVTVVFGEPMRWDVAPGDDDDPAVLRRVTNEIMDAIGALTGQERVAHYAKRHRPDELQAGADDTVGAGVAGPVAGQDATDRAIALDPEHPLDLSDDEDGGMPQVGGVAAATRAAGTGPMGYRAS